MQRAIKLQVNIGKDHLVKLPPEFPEGPAEVTVIAGHQAIPDMSSVRRAAIGRYEGQEFYMADDFDAPLPDDLLEAFEGGTDGRKP